MSLSQWAARIGAATLMAGLPIAGLPMAVPCALGVAAADGNTGQAAAVADKAHPGKRAVSAPRAAAVVVAPRAAAVRPTGSRPGPTARAAAARSARPAVAVPAPAPAAAVRTKATVAPATVAAAIAAPAALAPAAAAVGLPAPSAAATAESFPVIQGVVTAVDRFLTNTANWLYTLPVNPITDILQGAVYLIRRALFPSSVGVVTAPIQVPLYFADINDAGTQKVGIYVSLGGGAPQFFEFDTGGKGFYATYASGDPEFSPWWGDAVRTSSTQITNTYDSGLTYQGYAATTTVSLFAAPGSSMPLLTTGNSTVAQIDTITLDSQTLWGADGSTTAPVDGVFWGDFGMAPNYANNAVDSLIGQLTFACGVLPGYRIHIDPDTQTAWMQVGLTDADVQDPTGLYFPMIPDPDAPTGATVPNSGLRYYGEQLINARVNFFDGVDPLLTDSLLGITPDTGANTTLHNIPSDLTAYDSIVDWTDAKKDKGKVYKDLDFFLTGTTVSGSSASFFGFKTTDKVNDGQIKVQNQGIQTSVYYLNTGISLFFDYDVVYYLGTSSGGGALGLL